MNKKVATFGEILLRLSPPDHQRFSQATSFDAVYGGSEANVAVCLSRFGIPAKIITKIPNNKIGEACIQFFQQYGIDASQIKKDKNRLGIYFLERGISLRSSNVIYDRENSSISLAQREDFNWKKIFKDIDWFHWSGITPALSQNLVEITLDALKEARNQGIKISCDLNYRNLLWNYGKDPKEVMPELINFCNILIGNEASVELMLGISQKPEKPNPNDYDLHKDLSSRIKKRYSNLEYIFLTQRKSISATHNIIKAFLYKNKEFYESREFEIFPILDRIGGGDAFVGGVVYKLLKGDADLQSVINFAIASSALKLTIKGDINLVSVEEVLKLLSENGIDHVKR
jgi:2-dehydro-3-deoxygluconokinase